LSSVTASQRTYALMYVGDVMHDLGYGPAHVS
jgi:hypothetical protein